MNGLGKILFIALFAIANAQEIKKLRVGDTVNLSKNNSNKVIVSNIFNGFNESPYIEKITSTNFEFYMTYSFDKKWEVVKDYFYTDIIIDNDSGSSSSIFHDIDPWNFDSLGISRDYLDNQTFNYGFVKLCKEREIHRLKFELPQDIPVNKTVVLRRKQDSETHYVTSISTGTCVLQIYVYYGPEVDQSENLAELRHHFFKTPLYRSPIKTIDNNTRVEKAIKEYYSSNSLEYSLHPFPPPENWRIHQSNIMAKFENTDLIKVEMRSLKGKNMMWPLESNKTYLGPDEKKAGCLSQRIIFPNEVDKYKWLLINYPDFMRCD